MPAIRDSLWLMIIERLIEQASSKRAHVLLKRGRMSGRHKTTNTLAWVARLAKMVEQYIAARNKGRTYDGNMAVAALLGRLLVTWYANLQRAKGLDPNRPLGRKAVFHRLKIYEAQLLSSLHDDALMVQVWGGQQFNFPFGKYRKGGKFI